MKATKIIGLFLLSWLILLISLPLEGLGGFGDFIHFYRLAGLGWPFIDFWIEFPTVFPSISRMLYLLAGGKEHIYDYLLVILLTLAQAGSFLGHPRLLFHNSASRPGRRFCRNTHAGFARAGFE